MKESEMFRIDLDELRKLADKQEWMVEKEFLLAVAGELGELRAKIEAMERQEPVAWMDRNGTLYNTVSHVRASDKPLYLAPAHRHKENEMWQPIETAPKDQTFLAVLNCAGQQTICTMRWAVAEAKNSRPDPYDFHVERVTHWMPLPDLPGAKGEQ